MTDASPDWDELRRLATDLAAIEPRYRSSRATLMAHYSNATEPEHILALLDRAEKAEAEAARLREVARISEKLVGVLMKNIARIDAGEYDGDFVADLNAHDVALHRARALTGGDHG